MSLPIIRAMRQGCRQPQGTAPCGYCRPAWWCVFQMPGCELEHGEDARVVPSIVMWVPETEPVIRWGYRCMSLAICGEGSIHPAQLVFRRRVVQRSCTQRCVSAFPQGSVLWAESGEPHGGSPGTGSDDSVRSCGVLCPVPHVFTNATPAVPGPTCAPITDEMFSTMMSASGRAAAATERSHPVSSESSEPATST